jgi:LPS-assembly lipoprotein
MRATGNLLRNAAITIALLLTGCGWHLRGPVTFDNLPALAITGGNNALKYPLMNSLEDSGITVSDTAPVTLHLIREDWSTRTVAVDAQGRVAAQELTYELTWQLEKDGKPLMLPRTVYLVSNVNQDPTNATAASDEMELSKKSIRQDAIWRLQRQLQSISEHQNLLAPPHQTTQPATTPEQPDHTANDHATKD